MSNNTSPDIVIIEDEPKLAKVISEYIAAEKYNPILFEKGTPALEYLQNHSPAMVLLDIMLPDNNGFDICRAIRMTSEVPIVMVTARGHEADRILGFELGVDDYICKPFSPKELVSRVKAILKRVGILDSDLNLRKPALLVDLETYKATLNGVNIELTPIEFRILSTLVKQPGRVFSRDMILEHVYKGDHGITDRAIDSHIKNLRKKLKDCNSDDVYLKSVYGVGYKVDL